MPEDFARAMADAQVRGFFDGLSNSLQRYHVDQINGARAADTRARRIDRAVELFRGWKAR